MPDKRRHDELGCGLAGKYARHPNHSLRDEACTGETRTEAFSLAVASYLRSFAGYGAETPPEQMIEGQPAGPAAEQNEQHRRPLDVRRPRQRIDEDFDHGGHAEKHSGCRARQQSERPAAPASSARC